MNLSYIKKQLQFWADKKDVLHVKELLTKEDQILVKRKSEELIQNIFTFDKPWDMERCQIPYKLETLDWNIQLNDDEEWCFMLNRMDYLNYLVLSDHIEYAKTLILNWIEAHPTIQPEPSTRTLDTGIRLMNFFEALPYLYASNLLSDEEMTAIMTAAQNEVFNKGLITNATQLILVRTMEYLSKNQKLEKINVGDGVQNFEPVGLGADDFKYCQDTIDKASITLGINPRHANTNIKVDNNNLQQTNLSIEDISLAIANGLPD